MRIAFLFIIILFTNIATAQRWTYSDYERKHRHVLDLINTNHTIKAMKEAIVIENHADKDNSTYGHFVANDIRGHLFQTSKEHSEAITNYLNTFGYSRSTIDTLHIYTDLIDVYRLNLQFKEAKDYTQKANAIIKRVSAKNTRLYNNPLFLAEVHRFGIRSCFLYYDLHDVHNFKSGYRYLLDSFGNNREKDDNERLVEIYSNILDNNLQKALDLCIRFWPNSHYDIRTSIYEMMGRYKEATQAWNNNVFHNDTVLSKGQQKDINEISEEIGNNMLLASNQQMAMENTVLQLNLANLQLGKTKLENERSRQNQRLYQANANRSKIEIEKRNAELAVMKAHSKKEQLKHETERNKLRRKTLFLISITAVIVIIIIMLTLAILQIIKEHRRHREANERLKRAMQKAEESDRLKTAFLQQVSHETRTPLNAIAGFSQILPFTDDNTDEAKEMKRYIAEQTEVMSGLLRDIIALSESEDNDSPTLSHDTIKVNALCQSVADSIKPIFPQEVALELTSSLTDDDTFVTDKKMLTHIIRNLLSNAGKNTTSGSVTVNTVIDADHHLVISVTDTGCGIPEDMREAVFEKFVKVDDFKQGFGLGLSLSRSHAHALGGDITIDESYAGGARFIINIPEL